MVKAVNYKHKVHSAHLIFFFFPPAEPVIMLTGIYALHVCTKRFQYD